MPNQCSDQHPGAACPTSFQKGMLTYPKEQSLQEHNGILANPLMDIPHGPSLQSTEATTPRPHTSRSSQAVEFDFNSSHSRDNPNRQGQSDAIHPTPLRMEPTLPQKQQTWNGNLETSPIGQNPEVLNPDGHYVSLENLVTDPIPGFLGKGDLESIFPLQEWSHPSGSLLDDMETGNDSSSNDLNESDENGKESVDKSCLDFRPPLCSSNAFSLMMADSEHNPSTSGYSSEQPAKAKTQKDLMKILKELRSYLPPEKRSRGKSNTVAAVRYALHCIQQVKANEEYYQLLMANEKQPCGLDVSCYTIQEIANITTEYTKNNMDVFAVAVSLVTGQILYISEQATVVLRCGADVFSRVRFVELLAPQDVNVFYSSTTPYRLPSWSICNGADLGSLESLEEKSFYCRISCGRESRKELSYHPFRMTPYLIRAQLEDSGLEQLCCVLFAERVHSGYEAPRIPADKRIFTTTHTPSCLFQDVDERAVPLLGYLPQDLIGSPIILHLHPSDRPLMLAVHKKILQHGGQPFEFSPIRFCARNGEYITIDTSWSSFINPWSRKVAFIIGRHKVRMGPVNEDLFTAPPGTVDQTLQPEVQEITEQIHQLLMQPVHNSSSSGYGSLGSNGSHENPMSAASSSDSNGNINEDMKDIHSRSLSLQDTSLVLKEKHGSGSPQFIAQQNPEKQADDTSTAAPYSKDITKDGSGSCISPAQLEELPVKPHPYSYQQVNCLDSIIRYLESCNVLASAKRKWVSSCNTLSSTSDEDRNQMPERNTDLLQEEGLAMGVGIQLNDQFLSSIMPKLPGPAPRQYLNSRSLEDSDPGPTLNTLSEVADMNHCPLQPPVSITTIPGPGCHPSLASLPVPGPSSFPVLVPLPTATKAESVVSLTSHCSYSSTIVHVGDKKLHPEIEFEDAPAQVKAVPPEKEPCRRLGLTKEILLAHTQKEENDFLSGFMDVKKLSAFQSRCNSYLHERPGASRSRCPQGPDATWKKTGKNRKPKAKRVRPESWDSSSSGIPHPHRQPLTGLNTTAWSQSGTSLASYPPLPYPVLPAYTMPVFPPQPIPTPNEVPHVPTTSPCSMQPFTAPMFPPVMALVMPNYMYPPTMPPVIYPVSGPQPPFPVQPPSYAPQTLFPVAQSTALPTFPIPQPTFPVPLPVISVPQHAFPVPQTSYAPQPVQSLYPGQSAPQPHLPGLPKVKEGISWCSTPRNPQSPLLFQSRCSSPLQLNLLQLEESQKAERSELVKGVTNTISIPPHPIEEPQLRHSRAESPEDGQTSDARSACSDLMDLLLHEDASCGTCSASSAVSESMTSGSHGHGTSGSQTGSSLTSCSSKYFGSVDSSENNQLLKKTQGKETASTKTAIKYILQDPMWLLMANADENVMINYQIPLRDVDSILREDKEKLKCLQKLQPRFTDEQKKELGEIHSWIQRGGLPQAVEVKDCVYCRETNTDCTEYGETIQALELSGILESCD